MPEGVDVQVEGGKAGIIGHLWHRFRQSEREREGGGGGEGGREGGRENDTCSLTIMTTTY